MKLNNWATVVHYSGWEIHAHRQIHYPPFPDFTATCWQGNVMRFGGIEGRTIEDAIERAKRAIDGYGNRK